VSLAVPPPQAVIAAPSISCLAAVGARPPLEARFLVRFSYRRLARLNRARTCHEADAKALIRLAPPKRPGRVRFARSLQPQKSERNGLSTRAGPVGMDGASCIWAMSPMKEENA
jgi:hypothetical protein